MVQILVIAHTMKVSNFGNITFDVIKFKANTSIHNTLSYEHIKKLEQQLNENTNQTLRIYTRKND